MDLPFLLGKTCVNPRFVFSITCVVYQTPRVYDGVSLCTCINYEFQMKCNFVSYQFDCIWWIVKPSLIMCSLYTTTKSNTDIWKCIFNGLVTPSSLWHKEELGWRCKKQLVISKIQLRWARPVCHMTKRCNAPIMNDVASPFRDENWFTIDCYDIFKDVHWYIIKQIRIKWSNWRFGFLFIGHQI